MNKVYEIYEILLVHFGPQGWWPGDTAFEIMVGAVLTQNTNWVNVSKAINNLKKDELLHLKNSMNCRLNCWQKRSSLQVILTSRPNG